MSLSVRPSRAVLPILMSDGILLVRLVVCAGVHVTQVVSGANRCSVHMDVYADVLVVSTTMYPTVMVIRLSV